MTREKFARIVRNGDRTEIWLSALQTYVCLYKLFGCIGNDDFRRKLNYYVQVSVNDNAKAEDSFNLIYYPMNFSFKKQLSIDSDNNAGNIMLSEDNIQAMISLFKKATLFQPGELTDNAESVYVLSQTEDGLDIQIKNNSIETPLDDGTAPKYIASEIKYVDNKSITIATSLRYMALQIVNAEAVLKKAREKLGNRDFWLVYTYKNVVDINDISSVRVVLEREPGSIKKVIQNVAADRSSVEIFVPESFQATVLRPLLKEFADMNTTDAGFSTKRFFNNKKLYMYVSNDGEMRIMSA